MCLYFDLRTCCEQGYRTEEIDTCQMSTTRRKDRSFAFRSSDNKGRELGKQEVSKGYPAGHNDEPKQYHWLIFNFFKIWLLCYYVGGLKITQTFDEFPTYPICFHYIVTLSFPEFLSSLEKEKINGKGGNIFWALTSDTLHTCMVRPFKMAVLLFSVHPLFDQSLLQSS